MIKNLVRRVFGIKKTAAPARSAPKVLTRAQHGINRKQISECAHKVVRSLQEAGYGAFVVGGAVRDLLLGRAPKDFDVATNATPTQIRAVIRRSRVIGRRFQIVHALCGDETVEVSTFRAFQASGTDDGHTRDETGRVLRDNVFGTQAEDAWRRDFTVNALYYDPVHEEVWDYVDGVADIKRKRLRVIGDAESRYREDPVRMLRAVRFAAKLEFTLDAHTRAPITKLAPLLANVPASRLFDEMLKLLLSGHAYACVHQLRKEGLHHGTLPLLDVILEQPLGARFVDLALKSTDERINQGKPVTPGFLFAALLWHEVLAAARESERQGARPVPALHAAMQHVLDAQGEKIAIPRRFDAMMKEIWLLQPRFEQRSGARPFRLLENPRFRAAFDFLLLRCASGELPEEAGQWWQRFAAASAEERREMLLPETQPRKRRRRRRKARGGSGADAASVGTESA